MDVVLGRVWDGGRWRCDRHEMTAYADATNDPNPRYRGPAPVAPPMYHVRPLMGLLETLVADPDLAFDRLRLVHGEHAMSFARPLRHDDVLHLTAELTAHAEKPSGRVATFAIRGDVGGERVLDGTTTFFIRSATPPPKDGPKEKKAEPAAPPPPDLVVAQPVALDQAVRYAPASGDHNPIHLDEAVAKKAGLPGTILHGLCSMAFAARDLCDHLGGGDPARLASIAVRWSKPVLPGSTLSLQVWGKAPGPVTFVVLGPDGKPVITDGRAELR
jgi:acyl dehydratase